MPPIAEGFLETTYLKQLPFLAGNRPPSYERREVSRRKEKLFLSVVRVVSILERMGGTEMATPTAQCTTVLPIAE